jgi:predicted ATPase
MINEIEIRNFRSIKADKITLTPLTVLIGANGSGKSNLVKALEFISEIPKSGLKLSVSKYGGADGILPKAIPNSQLSKQKVSIKYTCCVPPPENDNHSVKSVDVTHEFEFSMQKEGRVRAHSESILFNKVLYIGRILQDRPDSKEIEKDSPGHPDAVSTIEIRRKGKRDSYSVSPPFNKDNLKTYLYWLGVDDLESTLTTPNLLKFFLKKLQEKIGAKYKDVSANSKGPSDQFPNALMLDPYERSVANYSLHFRTFKTALRSIKRYDLLLHELRREQAPSDSARLTKDGANLPAALRNLSKDAAQFQRLKDSFSIIAPHIANMQATSLRTVKELVEFVESSSGRTIESWQSSDGSLRALAILVVLETAEFGDTIIIEEPEQNLHPWAIRTLMDHVREVITEKSIQVILTTHSEHVLQKIHPDEVRIVSRTANDGTKFKTIQETLNNNSVEMGEVGRLWVKGLLGGIPSYDF